MQISKPHLDWLETRGIDIELAIKLGLYTGKSKVMGEGEGRRRHVFRDPQGDILAFPTIVGGTVVGEHYRVNPGGDGQKRFYQRKHSAQVFWNYECLLDPALEQGEPLIITEGQMDALAAMTCGFPFAVSMPSGSQKPPDGRLPEDLDPLDPKETDKPTGRFGSLYHARAQLKATRKIIIATDSDPSGIRLAAELVRRLGPGRCHRAEFPTGCKDLNDVLMKEGREAVIRVITKARPYPTRGIYRLSDFPDQEQPETWPIGWAEFDQHLKLGEGMFVPVTGVPQHGKSVFVINWLVKIALKYPIVIAISSFETTIKPVIQNRLRYMACGDRRWTSLHDDERKRIDDWIEEHFVFVEHDDREENVEDMTIDWFMDRMHDAIMRFNARIFLIDPWNEIEHARDFRESQAEYQNKAIRKLKTFCKRYQVTIICIAHPTKDVHEKGKIRRPNLYDIDGSSAWRNKADAGVIVYRADMTKNTAEIIIDKVKYEYLGKVGKVHFQFNQDLKRYEEMPDQKAMEL